MAGIEKPRLSDEELKIRDEAWTLAIESPDEIFKSVTKEAGLDRGEINDLQLSRNVLHPDTIWSHFRWRPASALFGLHQIERGEKLGPLERKVYTNVEKDFAHKRAPGLRKIENWIRRGNRQGEEGSNT